MNNYKNKGQYLSYIAYWGYIWAFIAAILWGAWYVPSAALWHEFPINTWDTNQAEVLVTIVIVLATLHALLVGTFQFLWLSLLGKTQDFFRTLWCFRGIAKWYFLAAIAGGLLANLGAYLAIGYIGPVFAAIAGLLYPVIGAVVARFWYKEKISKYSVMGIAIIVTGGIAIYIPAFANEVGTNKITHWLGYLGGAMTAIGWGMEGAIVGKALDVSDADCGVTIRYLAEFLCWMIFILPSLFIFTSLPIYETASQILSSWKVMMYLCVAAMSFAYCAIAWYKSFPLIGVGRGQAIGASYALFATLFTSLFTLNLPGGYFLIGLILVSIGSCVMILDSYKNSGAIRHITHPA